MPIKVHIPTPLHKLTHGEGTIQINSVTVRAALADLEKRHPGIKERLTDDGGNVRRSLNVYVNEEDIRFLQNQDTSLKDGDEISIIPAIAGG
jgi:molybdopterin synthase sulfur carrier subunit